MKKMKHDVPTRLVKVLILILMMVAYGMDIMPHGHRYIIIAGATGS